jgi:hypothetical protein
VATMFIGRDSRQPVAAQVCRHSILRRSPNAEVHLIDEFAVRQRALYWRQSEVVDGVTVDTVDRKPFSTEFSFSRFLVPFLAGETAKWVAFCDDDFLFLDDIERLFTVADDRYAVMCIQHNHAPKEAVKMDGRVQTVYRRKNWSSLVLWNCQHPGNKRLTVRDVNEQTGQWLHAFSWLTDEEIGAIPEEWNWLVGPSPTRPELVRPMRALHYTLGGPWFENHRDEQMAGAWLAEKADMDRTLARPAEAA